METTVERLLLRPEEGARALGLGRTKFLELVAAGEIRSITIGRSRRVPVEALREWLDRRLREESSDAADSTAAA